MRSQLIKLAQDSGLLPSSEGIYNAVRSSKLVAAMPNPSRWFSRAPVAENSATGKLPGETPVLSMGMSHGVIPAGNFASPQGSSVASRNAQQNFAQKLVQQRQQQVNDAAATQPSILKQPVPSSVATK